MLFDEVKDLFETGDVYGREPIEVLMESIELLWGAEERVNVFCDADDQITMQRCIYVTPPNGLYAIACSLYWVGTTQDSRALSDAEPGSIFLRRVLKHNNYTPQDINL